MSALRQLSFLLLIFFAAAGASGCGNHQRQELLESELRARDVQLRELLGELGKTENHNDALRHEVSVLRRGARISPEDATGLP